MSQIYLIVRQIPRDWRSRHLRNYFFELIKEKAFSTFHFKHRKENTRKLNSDSDQTSESLLTSCCIVQINSDSDFLSKFLLFDSRHWIGLNGETKRLKCKIEKIKIIENIPLPISTKERAAELKCRNLDSNFTRQDLSDLAELNPNRSVFPRGNVGTTDSEFRNLIKLCKMPTSVLKSLKLDFTKNRKRKKYSVLTHYYNNNIHVPQLIEQTFETRNGHTVISGSSTFRPAKNTEPEVEPNRDVACSPGSDPEVININREKESENSEDDFGMEGWEIHQAFNEDGSLARRNHRLNEENINYSASTKERSFESEIELTWEKGGSGLVFHTDQAYWKEIDNFDGDIFDEEGFNQWGLDNSAFYDPHGGDKDANDFVNLTRDQIRRGGIVPEEKLKENLLASFGGKYLKNNGWTQTGSETGSGTGSLNGTRDGIVDPIKLDYRHPTYRGGLGYHGQKIQISAINKQKLSNKTRNEKLIKISTIYDEPDEMEMYQNLPHRRRNF